MALLPTFSPNAFHFMTSLSGCAVVQHSPQDFEVWGADISNHYWIAVADDRIDVVYIPDTTHAHFGTEKPSQQGGYVVA